MAFEDDVRRAGYEPLGEVRSGGTSDVHRARSIADNQVVAIKVYHRGAEARAERELAIGRAVDDWRLALPFTGGRLDDGRAFTVSRWIDGISLRDLIEMRGAVSLPIATKVISDVGAALAVLHASGAVHRDVTPSNVIVSDDVAVLIDVGHGRGSGAADVTATGDLSGTPRYLAPEMILGAEPTPAADQYALALVAYELLTGSGPFPDGGTAATALHHQLNTEPEPLDERDPRIPFPMSTAVEAALAKDPSNRWRSVEEFVAAFSGESIVPSGRRRRSRVAGVGAAVGAIAFGLTGVAVSVTGGGNDGVDDADPVAVTAVAETEVSAGGAGGAPDQPDTDDSSDGADEPAASGQEPAAQAEDPVAAPDADSAADDASTAAAGDDGETVEPVDIPPAIPSSLAAGTATQLECNLLAETDFEAGFISYNYFDNEADPTTDGQERVLPSGGVDGTGVLVVGDPGAYGRYAETVAILPGQRYEFTAAVLPVEPLFDASIGISWLDEDFTLLDGSGGRISVVGAEPGRIGVVSDPAPPNARYATPELFKDSSDGVLLADELVFAEAGSGCSDPG